MLLSAIKPDAFDSARQGTADIFAPVLEVVSQPVQQAALFVRDVTGLATLQAENMRLTQENEELREWYQTAMLLDSENKALRDLLNVKIDPQLNFISARIMSDSGNTYVKSLLVNAGAQDGVKKGQAVLSGEGLIGRIVEVSEKTARILLITDMNSRVPVVVDETLQHAVMAGTNENAPQLIHLPQDSKIADGARIMTSGHGGVFPPGLAVGRIKILENERPVVMPFSDLSRMMYVRIVSKTEDPNLRSAAINTQIAR